VNTRHSYLLVAVVSCLSLGSASAGAREICSGIEAQVRLAAGETFVTTFQANGNAPYVPATPYGYVGYRLPSGISFGIGLGFLYFQNNNNVPTQLVANSGWALMVAPTLQIPVMKVEDFEFFGVGRFILGAGSQTLQVPAAPVSTGLPFMIYGGNLGVGGTWYPTSRFGFGAEAGMAVNAYNATATTTTAGVTGPGFTIPNIYVQTYFALTATYIF
jgi:hypothetical protein